MLGWGKESGCMLGCHWGKSTKSAQLALPVSLQNKSFVFQGWSMLPFWYWWNPISTGIRKQKKVPKLGGGQIYSWGRQDHWGDHTTESQPHCMSKDSLNQNSREHPVLQPPQGQQVLRDKGQADSMGRDFLWGSVRREDLKLKEEQILLFKNPPANHAHLKQKSHWKKLKSVVHWKQPQQQEISNPAQFLTRLTHLYTKDPVQGRVCSFLGIKSIHPCLYQLTQISDFQQNTRYTKNQQQKTHINKRQTFPCTGSLMKVYEKQNIKIPRC